MNNEVRSFLMSRHDLICFENGDHPEEVDTPYSLASDALGRIEELEAQLAKVTAEKLAIAQKFDEWHTDPALMARIIMTSIERDCENQTLREALPRAFRIGLEDAAKHIFTLEHDGTKPEWVHQGAWAFTLEQAAGRAPQTPTPTDLVERAMKEAGK